MGLYFAIVAILVQYAKTTLLTTFTLYLTIILSVFYFFHFLKQIDILLKPVYDTFQMNQQSNGARTIMSKEHWNDSFSDTEYVYGEVPNQFIQEKAQLFSKQAHITCFAEGEGRNAVY